MVAIGVYLPLSEIIFTAMDLNEFEYQMLDALLDAFGSGDTLTREQVLELFEQDEAFAVELVGFLISEGLAVEIGLTNEHGLPSKLLKLAKADDFLGQGGFTNRPAVPAGPKKPVWDDEHLKKRNTELQNEVLKLQRMIRDKEGELLALAQKVKYLEKYKYMLYGALVAVVALAGWILWYVLPVHGL
jgi:hypothetical protein